MKKLIYICLIVFLAAGCNQEEIMNFTDRDYLSVDAAMEGDFPQYTFTFMFEDNEVTEKSVQIPVVVTGRTSETDRKFTVRVVDTLTTAIEGTHYLQLDQSQNIVKADTVRGSISVTVKKTADLKDEAKTLGLEIVDDNSFLQGPKPIVVFKFSNRIEKPNWWYPGPWYYPNIGYFTEVKARLWFEFWGITDGTDPWSKKPSPFYTESGYINYINREASVEEFKVWLRKHKDAPLYDEDGNLVLETIGILEN